MTKTTRTTSCITNELQSDLENGKMLFSYLAETEKDTGLRVVNEAYTKVFEKRMLVMSAIHEARLGDIVPSAMKLASVSVSLVHAVWAWKGTQDTFSNYEYETISSDFSELLQVLQEQCLALIKVGKEHPDGCEAIRVSMKKILDEMFVKLIGVSTRACEFADSMIHAKLADGERTLH